MEGLGQVSVRGRLPTSVAATICLPAPAWRSDLPEADCQTTTRGTALCLLDTSLGHSSRGRVDQSSDSLEADPLQPTASGP